MKNAQNHPARRALALGLAMVMSAAGNAALAAPPADSIDLYAHPPPGSSVPDAPVQIAGNVITLSAYDLATCAAAGGCVLVPREALRDKLAATHRAAVAGCKNSI